jgi:hypothetical protein
MPGKGKGKKPVPKKTKNEKKEEEARLDEQLTADALPKYLTDGIVILDKNVLCESIFLYTPDGKVRSASSLALGHLCAPTSFSHPPLPSSLPLSALSRSPTLFARWSSLRTPSCSSSVGVNTVSSARTASARPRC